MNAAWGGISEETEIIICVDGTHKTADTAKLRPLLYDPMSHAYRVPGEIAAMAFNVGMSLK